MSESNETPTAPAATKVQFLLQRVYTRDISFESPGAPAIFAQEWNPESNVQFTSGATRVADKQYEVVLQVTVTANNQGKTVYIAEVRQAGVFLIEGLDANALEQLLGTQCPNILFPYARATLTDMVARGTLPQLLLQPINFDAVFAEARRRREQKVAETAAKH